MKAQPLVPMVVVAPTVLLPYSVPDACFMRDYDDGWKDAGCDSQWDTGW